MSTKLADPVTFECRCGAQRNAIGNALPDGWTILNGASWCPDCTSAGVPARSKPRRRQSARRGR